MAEGIKFLQLTNKPPFPPMDGGAIGMNNISQGLINEGYNLKIFSVNTHKHFVDIANLPEEYISKTSIEFGFIDTRIKNIDALINLFSSKSYNIKRFFDKKFESKLIEILLSIDFDIVQMESIFLMHYLPTIKGDSGTPFLSQEGCVQAVCVIVAIHSSSAIHCTSLEKGNKISKKCVPVRK